MKKILITGADGFIGRNLIVKLLQESVEIYAIVHPKNNIYMDKEIENLYVFPLELSNLLQNIESFPLNIDVMYHLAWNGVKPELRNDLHIQMQNIDNSLDCIKLAEKIGIKKVVFPGSTSEYLYYNKPLNKEALPSPSNSYGATKIAVRYICGDYAKRCGIEFIYTIITGIYAEDRKDNNVIYYTIDKLLRKEKPSLTKLEQLWDYVHIDDVVDALIAIGMKGKDGAVYAIGHGDNWRLRNYIEIIHEMIDPSLPLGIGEVEYQTDVLPSSCVDLSDLKKDTGFSPKVDFESGIARVIEKIKSDMRVN